MSPRRRLGPALRHRAVGATALAVLLLMAPLFAVGSGPAGVVRQGAPRAGSDQPVVRAGAGFFPVRPAALLAGVLFEPGQTRRFRVAGTPAGVPGEGVIAVALNVEIVTAARPATVTVFPAGTEPAAGVVTVAAGAEGAASGFTIQQLPSTGELDVRGGGGSAAVTVRVRGYYAATCASTGAMWHPVQPSTLLDTTLEPRGSAELRVGGAGGGTDGGVEAVTLAVEASGARAPGRLQVRPAGVAAPDDATLAFTPDRPASVLEVVRPGPDGQVSVTNSGQARVGVRVRLIGYHASSVPGADRGAEGGADRGGGSYQALNPSLLLDTTIRAGTPVAVRVAGAGGLPVGSGTATPELAVVATDPTADGQLAVATALRGPPAATVGLHADETAAASILPRPGAGGWLWLSVSEGSAKVRVWAHGWFGVPTRLTAAPDIATLATFDRLSATEPGWTSGSVSAPVGLPSGGTAWLFGEAFLGILRPDGSQPPRTPGPPRGKGPLSTLLHNSVVVQAGAELTTHNGPVDRATGYPTELLSPAGAGDERWYWPGNGLVEGPTLRVFVQEIQRLPQNGFTWTGRNRLVSLSLPRMTVVADTPLPGAEQGSSVQWGAAVLEEAAHTYVYGTQEFPGSSVKLTHVARFPRGGATSGWQFWDGAAWVRDPAASAPLAGSGGAGPVTGATGTVARLGAGYVLLSIADAGTSIDVRASCSLIGPWSAARPLYQIPEMHPARRPGDRAFLARGYPVGNGLLVAYSLSTDGLFETMRRASYYRPRYVRVR